jgi:xylulokinase
MESHAFMGLDIGTQSVKCVICVSGETSDIVYTGQSNALTVDIISDISGSAEQNPIDWISAIKDAITDAVKQDRTVCDLICGMGVSGQQHGLVCLGEDRRVIRPCMLWCDTRCSEEAVQISQFSNRHIPAGYTSPKILWMVKHEPELFAMSAQFMLPHDFINFYLRGGLQPDGTVVSSVMECGDGSGTGLFDPATRSLDRAAMDFIHPDLHRKLPGDLCGPNDCIGHVHPQVLRELFGWEEGRKVRMDVKLSVGSGDNAMALLGATSLVLQQPIHHLSQAGPHADPVPPPLVLSLGTSGTIMQSWERRPEDSQGVVSCFCDATGHWMPLVCVQNCTRVPQEILSAHCNTAHPDWEEGNRAEIELAAAAERPGSEGVAVLPYFSPGGERTPDWPRASGCLLGLRHGHLQRPALLYRSALEGATCALLRGYRCMQQMSGSTAAQTVTVVGGGAHSALWLQIISDMFDLPVTTLPARLSGHIGAIGATAQCMAVVRGVKVGTVRIRVASSEGVCISCQPTTSAQDKALYRELFERHIKISNALFSSTSNSSSLSGNDYF